MNEPEHTRELDGEHGRLVDLVSSALVDPNLNTERRLRLHDEISQLVLAAHDELHGHEQRAAREAVAQTDGGLQTMLASVLVNPDLNTATRMRLHHRISNLVRVERDHAGARG
jgi:hypothetical protein